jgi:hypothetical protein
LYVGEVDPAWASEFRYGQEAHMSGRNFISGKFGRSKVCSLKKGELEIPSDIAGLVYSHGSDGRMETGSSA